MKVCVNKDACIGCGACTVIADNIFEIGDDGLSQVINPTDQDNKTKDVPGNEKENVINPTDQDNKTKDVPGNEKENVIDACESCPTGAIEIIEE